MEILFVPDMTNNRPPKPAEGKLFWAEVTTRKNETHRCPWVLWKWHDGSGARSLKEASWRCGRTVDHDGPCKTRPSAHQRSEFQVVSDWETDERTVLPTVDGFVYCTHVPDLSKKVGRGESAERRMFEPFKFHRSGTGFAHCWAVADQVAAEKQVHGWMKRDGLWLHHELFTACADPYVSEYLSLSRRQKQSDSPHLVKARLRYEQPV